MRTVVLVIGTALRPWTTSRTWRGLVHLLLDLPIGFVTVHVVLFSMVLSVALLIVFPFALPFVWFTFVFSRVAGWFERSRFAALVDLDLPDPVPPLSGGNPWYHLGQRLKVIARWKEIGYLLLLFPLGMLTTSVALLVWCGSVALAALPLYLRAFPDDTAHFWLVDIHPGGGAAIACILGLLGIVFIAPWMTTLLIGLDHAVGRFLLTTDREKILQAELSRVESSRVAAVDSAEAERRRIERDLHDGAQQRLVALAMDLGAARERLETDPEEGRELVASAHEELKAAIRELRDLVRGIHPVILEDRGLDAALSAVVARAPVPVRLSVDLTSRPTPAVESTCYFFVSEALTNVARHAAATAAAVEIAQRGQRIVIEVRDNGVGGAALGRGSGLDGLRDRVVAMGGWMQVVSPIGGPTTLTAEVPCAS